MLEAGKANSCSTHSPPLCQAFSDTHSARPIRMPVATSGIVSAPPDPGFSVRRLPSLAGVRRRELPPAPALMLERGGGRPPPHARRGKVS